MSLNNVNSLSHTKWDCKYHVVFAPKYRRRVFYREKKAAIGKILRDLCEWKGVRIVEAENFGVKDIMWIQSARTRAELRSISKTN